MLSSKRDLASPVDKFPSVTASPSISSLVDGSISIKGLESVDLVAILVDEIVSNVVIQISLSSGDRLPAKRNLRFTQAFGTARQALLFRAVVKMLIMSKSKFHQL